MNDGLDIAIFGSSLVSSWWNGACTYYRGIIRELHALGHRVTFYEPIAYERQEHRDIDDPEYANVVIYPARDADDARAAVAAAGAPDVIVKTSGVGVHDDVLEAAVAAAGGAHTVRVFWDVDAPATLARLEADRSDPLRALLPQYDAVFTYGGGEPVVRRYTALGAARCDVVYNALDPATHHPVAADRRFAADCSLLANRLPDREERIHEFFFRAAALSPGHSFLLGGNGWEGTSVPPNVRCIGHVGTEDHNAFNCSARTVLNVTRVSMVENGWSPATRVFEAAGAGACLISDEWPGLGEFFEPGVEMLGARDGGDVAAHVTTTSAGVAKRLGERARERALAQHTYAQRAATVDTLLRALVAQRVAGARA